MTVEKDPNPDGGTSYPFGPTAPTPANPGAQNPGATNPTPYTRPLPANPDKVVEGEPRR